MSDDQAAAILEAVKTLSNKRRPWFLGVVAVVGSFSGLFVALHYFGTYEELPDRVAKVERVSEAQEQEIQAVRQEEADAKVAVKGIDVTSADTNERVRRIEGQLDRLIHQ